ncbi:MAG: hypothetical protein CL993_00570 [Euryarchaeota archaeon]|nr:hypothetical protein [Euryarchaeota archaeon]
MVEGAILLKRVLLASTVIVQITLAPIILFALTYLPEIDTETATIGIRTELIYWVLVAGISYGIISICLALLMGGFRPFFVSNQGGWLPFLRLSRRVNDPELIDRARMSSFVSPYGKMIRLVNKRITDEDDDLMSIHGGLQLLAVPMQVILIAVPLAIMEGVPQTIIKPNRAFELGMAGYIIALWIGFRIQPIISTHLVGIASMFRNVVWRVSRLSWILPIFLYWVFARVFLSISLDWLGVDYSKWHEMQLESVILHSIAPEANIPPTAILDYIVAISVLPVATFTTISVLGGSLKIPKWMNDKELELESLRGMELEQTNLSDEEITESDDQILDENLSNTNEEDGEDRMIDLPFNLFDSN